MFEVFNWVSGAISWTGNAVNSVTTAIDGAAKSVLGAALRTVVAGAETISKVAATAGGVIKVASAGLSDAAAAAANGIGSAASTFIANPQNLGGVVSALATGVVNTVKAAGSGIANTAVATVQGGVQSVSSMMSFVQTSTDSLVTLAVALLTIPFGFNQWQMVELPVSSGASCGNGSPYRFFVNKTPLTSNAIVYLEGGGNCRDYKTCSNQPGVEMGLFNKFSEIPRDYMTFSGLANGLLTGSQATISVAGLESPFIARMHPGGKVQTQGWNIVFAPYCTGDLYVGNKVKVYTNPDDDTTPQVFYHKGEKNMQLVAAWMKANLPRPDKFLITGSSAGGYGATINYGTFRDALMPKKTSAMMSDAGMFFWAPLSDLGTPQESPSLRTTREFVLSYGVGEPGKLLSQMKAKYPDFDTDNFGTIMQALANHYPNDRFGLASFASDLVIGKFLYMPLPEYALASNKQEFLESTIRKDIDNTLFNNHFSERRNLGYYIPNWRAFFFSHCLAGGTFGNTGIPELEIKSVTDFVDNLLDNNAVPVMRAYEKNRIKRTLASETDDYLDAVLGPAVMSLF